MAAAPVPGLLRARYAAQRLTGPPAVTAEAAVEHLLAVQGQDPRGFRLAVRARTTGVTAADVEAALTERRTLVVSWLNRGTLHLVRADDFWWLHDLTTPQLGTESVRRLGQEGVPPALAERGVAVIVDEIDAHGPRTREELRAALDAAGVPTRGQALVHVLLAATLQHRIVRGPVRGTEHCLVRAEHWLAEPAAVPDRDGALAMLARRYLAAHGPASDRDLAMWAKLPLREVRAGLASIADETRTTPDGLIDLADRGGAGGDQEFRDSPPTRLLGNFDPVLHGWVSRQLVLGAHEPDVVIGGIFRSFALVDGRPAGLWRIEGGRVRIAPFAPLTTTAERALVDDARAVAVFLGLPAKDPVVR